MTPEIESSNRLWLLIDAAGLENGRVDIDESSFSALECLFTGDLAVELADCAPYLGLIEPVNDESMKVVERYASKDCAIVLQGEAPELTFTQAHRHFRKFNVVYGADGQPLFFRYYDGRVLPTVLEVFDAQHLKAFFGPFRCLFTSGTDGKMAMLEVVGERLSVSMVDSPWHSGSEPRN